MKSFVRPNLPPLCVVIRVRACSSHPMLNAFHFPTVQDSPKHSILISTHQFIPGWVTSIKKCFSSSLPSYPSISHLELILSLLNSYSYTGQPPFTGLSPGLRVGILCCSSVGMPINARQSYPRPWPVELADHYRLVASPPTWTGPGSSKLVSHRLALLGIISQVEAAASSAITSMNSLS